MKTIKAPDLQAPRLRNKSHGLLNFATLSKFKKEHKEYKDLDMATFKKIVSAFNEKLWQTVINERDGVTLPEQLGYLFIGSCESSVSKTNIDFKKSLELGMNVTLKNLESDSKLAKIFYTNYGTKYKFQNRDLWKFVATRQFKRTVAKEYPSRWKQYIEVAQSDRVSSLFNEKPPKADDFVKMESELLELYDEFNFN
jgi:hypothetical protein